MSKREWTDIMDRPLTPPRPTCLTCGKAVAHDGTRWEHVEPYDDSPYNPYRPHPAVTTPEEVKAAVAAAEEEYRVETRRLIAAGKTDDMSRAIGPAPLLPPLRAHLAGWR